MGHYQFGISPRTQRLADVHCLGWQLEKICKDKPISDNVNENKEYEAEVAAEKVNKHWHMWPKEDTGEINSEEKCMPIIDINNNSQWQFGKN